MVDFLLLKAVFRVIFQTHTDVSEVLPAINTIKIYVHMYSLWKHNPATIKTTDKTVLAH